MFKTRAFRKFITAFSITIISSLIVAVGVFAALNYFVRPPEVERQVQVIRHLPSIDEPPASIPGEPEPAGGVLAAPAPVVIEIMDRKPLFYTFLVYGLDEGYNADTIMVGAFDGGTGNAYLIGIPRDTRVDVQRRNRKIVTAYAAGRLQGRGHAGGIEQLKTEVQSLVGFRPDFYVSVDYQAFVSLVDSLGGVNVYVPRNMNYTDPIQDLRIRIPEGKQLLDGENALNFARFRRCDEGRSITDFQRMENQQALMMAVASELMTPSIITRIPDFVRIYREYVTTSLTYGEKMWFAEQLASGSIDLQTYTLPISGTSGAPNWYELPYRNGIVEMVNRTINPFIQDISPDMLRIAS